MDHESTIKYHYIILYYIINLNNRLLENAKKIKTNANYNNFINSHCLCLVQITVIETLKNFEVSLTSHK